MISECGIVELLDMLPNSAEKLRPLRIPFWPAYPHPIPRIVDQLWSDLRNFPLAIDLDEAVLYVRPMIACLRDPFLNCVGHVTLATAMRDQLLPFYHYFLFCHELEIRQP